MKICVLASTNGTDLQAILDEMAAGAMPGVELVFVLTDKRDCGAAEKARKAGIPLVFLDGVDEEKQKIDRERYDRYLEQICKAYDVDLIVLVGWMRLFSPYFVKAFPRRIINVHPSLLPKYPGMDKNVHRAVLDAGETVTGMTIHYVDEGMDTGEIILQKSCEVDPDDTVVRLKKKVQALEREWYPKVIAQLARAEKDKKSS